MEIAVADMADDRRDEPLLSMSRLVSVTHSASREIGTQTSVDDDLARPGAGASGPEDIVARLPEPRALLRPRSPIRNGPPPNSRAISPKRSDCSATPASVPWNSRNSVGVSGRPSLE